MTGMGLIFWPHGMQPGEQQHNSSYLRYVPQLLADGNKAACSNTHHTCSSRLTIAPRWSRPQPPHLTPLIRTCFACCLCAAGVTVEVKARQVRVKGPRGVLARDFKHLSVDMYLIEEEGQKKLKVGWQQAGGCTSTATGQQGGRLLGYRHSMAAGVVGAACRQEGGGRGWARYSGKEGWGRQWGMRGRETTEGGEGRTVCRQTEELFAFQLGSCCVLW